MIIYRIICAVALAWGSAAAAKPNIIVIMADDMGYSDIGCFGSEIQTPNLDRLAAQGLRFAQFYNTARCCPSRASLLTGLYSHQAGVGYMDDDRGVPSYQGHLNNQCVTIAELLGEHGYRTIMSGKWHLGTDTGCRPWERGFQRFYGIPEGGGVYFWPTKLQRTVVLCERDSQTAGPQVTSPDERFYSTDAFTDHAVQQINKAGQDAVPFFLYLPYVTPHFPQQAWARDIQKYIGKYRRDWAQLRQRRFAKQITLGIVDKTWRLPPSDALDWEGLTEAQKTKLDRQMAVYAAQIDNLDQNIGRIVTALKKQDLLSNTLILFFSDNGGQKNAALGNEDHPQAMFGSRESFGKYARGWANMSNTPFREYKQKTHAGGIASPFIAHWPERIRAAGQIRHQVCHIIDIMPTCLEAAGLAYPDAWQGKPIMPLVGQSLLPHLLNNQAGATRTLFWEHMGNRAVRQGHWKLVAHHKRSWELYDLGSDPTELHDLSASRPDRVQALASQWDQWAERCGVLPWPVKPKGKR